MIRDLIADFIKKEKERGDEEYAARESSNLLYVSAVGYCPRKEALRLTGVQHTNPFSQKTLNAFHNGNLWEEDTAKMLREIFPDLVEQLELKDEFWSGKADFKYEQDGKVVIAEHKSSGDKYFNYRKSLPRLDHVLQVAMYGYLYKKLFGEEAALKLFYRTWGNTAEFDVTVADEKIFAIGEVNGKYLERVFDVSLQALREQFEAFYQALPELPPRLEDKNDGCYFNGKPGCVYYDHCWS